MHALGITRKIDKLGRMVIPIELRESLGLDQDTKVEIFINPEEKALILKKYERGCSFCGEMKDKNIEYKGKNICKSCAEEIFDKADGEEELF